MPQPIATRESRPWTRWWWMGSAVSETEITRHLELFHQAGFGGVEISSIYGVEGEAEHYVAFLSPRWVELLRYTLAEAERLDLGVDMIVGTGWPLGGPWVSAEDAAARVLFEVYTLRQGDHLDQDIRSAKDPTARLLALVACSAGGDSIDLTGQVDAARRLTWATPAGQWRLYALFQMATGQQVKRAAPGGEGNVVDHFSGGAIQRYLERFDAALAALPAGEHVRSFFNDSYEVYGANWTPDLLDQFQRRRGYDLRHHLPAFFGEGDLEIVGCVRADYRQTVADLLLDQFVKPWSAWCHRHGARSRNQAHGSPGNLLDLYAAVDIPETETFGTDWLRLVGLAPLNGHTAGGRADPLVGKMASSAAHIAGRPLCSSETFTWLGEHGQTPLSHMKPEVDLLFTMGINHIFCHGTPFSPADAAWPGWMFYATTHVAPTNPFWRDLAPLNAYITRCQSALQAGKPDNDLLLYFPIADLWHAEHGARDLLHFLVVDSQPWLDNSLPTFTATARRLWDRGYSFDFVSDHLLREAIGPVAGRLEARGESYRALVVAGCTLMPHDTLERILELTRAGATVLVVGDLPRDVPGLGHLAERRAQFHQALGEVGALPLVRPGIAEAQVGQGRLLVGDDVEGMLALAGVWRESIVDLGVQVIRRRDDHGRVYFLANLGTQPVNQSVTLATEAAAVMIIDPLTARRGLARSSADDAGGTRLYLQLEPGESLLLHALSEPAPAAPWPYLEPAGQTHRLEGPWRVEFIEGGPTLPTPRTIDHLTSWTEWPDGETLRSFSGTARYTLDFDAPQAGVDDWALDLGMVHDSARVRLNGADLGTFVARPFRAVVTGLLRGTRTRIEIEVTNLMANRLAHLDRQGIHWRKFFFINIDYEDFDASGWEPLPSGLLGPVRLIPTNQRTDQP